MQWRKIPPLTALRAFAAAAECQNLTRASEALFVTHAAVSQQVRILEEHLGVKLFERNAYGITLTANGEYLAQGLISAFGEIESRVQNLSRTESKRPLIISTTPMFAAAFLTPRLSAFVNQNPDIELNVDSTIESVDLSRRDIDLAIRYGTGNWLGYESELLLPGRLTVVAAKKLVGDKQFKQPADLLEFPILQEYGSVEFDLWLEKAGIPASEKRKALRVPGNILLDGIRRGDGIGATVPAFITDELKSGKLVALFDDPEPNIGYYLVTLHGKRRKTLQSFCDWLKSSVNDVDIPELSVQPGTKLAGARSIDYSGEVPKLSLHTPGD